MMKAWNRGATALCLLIGLAVTCLGPAPALAREDLRIDITQGRFDPIPIAVRPFYGTQPDTETLGTRVADVISANLHRSGLFDPIDPAAFIGPVTGVQVRPRFGNWAALKAEALVKGSITPEPDGRLKFEYRLWDVARRADLVASSFTTPERNWRRVAHLISDQIYERVTGETGYFDTRIVYIAETGPRDRRVKRLAVMDQDGANHRYLTDGRHLVLTPRFSPTAQELVYLGYYQRNRPRVYLFNIVTGQQAVLGDFPGMTLAPRFAPDGTGVIMSMAKDGATNIYTLDLATRVQRRLTGSVSDINVSPTYSPDGEQVVFVSDRTGTKQLYVMRADGSNMVRISRERGQYDTPVWSPRGDLIAFTKTRPPVPGSTDRYYIGVMRPDGRGERLLVGGYLVEGPTWSPNGRVLLYAEEQLDRATGTIRRLLRSVDLTGQNHRVVPTPVEASDPAWSGLLQ